MITYLDRVCISIMFPMMQAEFDWTDVEKGWIFGAFTLAYAAFEIPTGWLGDLFGPRKTLIRIVLWWSVFTALTAMIFPSGQFPLYPFIAMMTVRFMFGVGEAGAYPNIARALHNWFPYKERGFAKGAVWMAGRFAGGITPLIVFAMLYDADVNGVTVTQWRHTFWIFGSLGLVWCVFFWLWFRDRPEQMAGVNQAEIAAIQEGESHSTERVRVPWKKLFTNTNLWCLCGMYFCASYGWYFNITYMPGVLKEYFGVNFNAPKWSSDFWRTSIMTGMPLLVGSLACLIGGLLTDFFIRKTGNRKWGRRLFGVLGHGMCGICYFLSIIAFNAGSAWGLVIMVAAASFWNDITMGAAWASCLDIGRKFSGIVAGAMNTIGNLGGFMANILTGYIISISAGGLERSNPGYLDATRSGLELNLAIFGSVYFIAVILWLNFDATKPIEES